jgi:phage gpG-like protein
MSEIRFNPSPEQALQQLRQFPQRTLNAVATAMDRENELTVAFIIERKLSHPKGGPPAPDDGLRVGDSRLRNSIRHTKARVLVSSVESSIGSNVEYAGIHEFGGQTRPHIIRAKNGKALMFAGIFRKSVKHPGSKFKERAFIRRSIEARKENYAAAFGKAIARTWEGGS